MELITLIPGLLCLVAIARRGTAYALPMVVLPTLLLLPIYFSLVARPLPSLNFIDCALIVLGAGMVIENLGKWRFTPADAGMAMFVISTGYADRQFGHTTDSIFALFDIILTAVVPYMAGKLLIEGSGARNTVVKAYILLIAWPNLFSLSEYFVKRNLYTWFWSHFYPGQWSIWHTQIRWGGGRVAGPFAQSEAAGMMVGAAFIFALWMGRQNWLEKLEGREAPLKNGKLYIFLTFFAVLITQARGPWIGAILAAAVASIGFSKRPVRRAIIVTVCIVGIGGPIYVFGKSYLAGPRKDYGSEKETAQYRAELIQNYIPVAVKGGDWGYGKSYPVIGGQKSIDNEYLYVWLTNGMNGLLAFLMIMASTFIELLIRIIRSRDVRERHFATTLMGLYVGMAFTLSTVYLGSQTCELFFLLVGWSQTNRSHGWVSVARPVQVRVYT